MKVFVYWNLHRKLWSIKALEGPRKGLVVGHAHMVHLMDATPRVSQKGRERVLREQKKNVHAGIVGTLVEEPEQYTTGRAFNRVTYNPYRFSTFVYADHVGHPEYTGSQNATLVVGKVYAY